MNIDRSREYATFALSGARVVFPHCFFVAKIVTHCALAKFTMRARTFASKRAAPTLQRSIFHPLPGHCTSRSVAWPTLHVAGHDKEKWALHWAYEYFYGWAGVTTMPSRACYQQVIYYLWLKLSRRSVYHLFHTNTQGCTDPLVSFTQKYLVVLAGVAFAIALILVCPLLFLLWWLTHYFFSQILGMIMACVLINSIKPE